jgi:hypothetical protein
MMNSSECCVEQEIETEIKAFVAWSIGLHEMSGTRPFGMSRRFESSLAMIYARAGTPGILARGGPAIAIADIHLERPGEGFFSGLVDTLVARAATLPYRRLEVENVGNQRFAAWLLRRGFQTYPQMAGCPLEVPSLMLELRGGIT